MVNIEKYNLIIRRLGVARNYILPHNKIFSSYSRSISFINLEITLHTFEIKNHKQKYVDS